MSYWARDDSLLSNATAGWVRLSYERNFGMATGGRVPAEAKSDWVLPLIPTLARESWILANLFTHAIEWFPSDDYPPFPKTNAVARSSCQKHNMYVQLKGINSMLPIHRVQLRHLDMTTIIAITSCLSKVVRAPTGSLAIHNLVRSA
jgi:hypothetical protein